MTFRNIVIATDFGEPSDQALLYGRQLAQTFGSTLHVIHVVGNIAGTALGGEDYTTDFVALQRQIEEAARKQLDALVTEQDRRTLSLKTMTVTSSTPAQAIVSYAQEAHADLVIVGTHGRGGMAHLLMGSVAERVVRTAPCPVLTVRGHGPTP